MSMHPMTNHHVPGIWTHLGETLHIWRHHLGETLYIWRQRYQVRQELARWTDRGPARRWPLVERHRQRSRKTLLAGLIRQPSAGAATVRPLEHRRRVWVGTSARDAPAVRKEA
jgi:hypothetical protein